MERDNRYFVDIAYKALSDAPTAEEIKEFHRLVKEVERALVSQQEKPPTSDEKKEAPPKNAEK
jgi:hypothetical protein